MAPKENSGPPYIVRIENVPPTYTEEELCNSLVLLLIEGMIMIEMEDTVALIEFASYDEQKEAEVLLQEAVIGGYTIKVLGDKRNDSATLLDRLDDSWSPGCADGDSDDSLVNISTTNGTNSSKNGNPGAPDMPSEVASSSTGNASSEAVIPNSKELARLASAKNGIRSTSKSIGHWENAETAMLLDELILRRLLFLGKKKFPLGFWTDVSNSLWLKNVNFSADSCRKKKKNLDLMYDKVLPKGGFIGKEKWNFFEKMSALSDPEREPNPPEHTPVEAEEGDSLKDGDNQSCDVDLSIIMKYADRKEKFNQPAKYDRDRLYNEVANELAVEETAFLSGEEVKKRMAHLRQLYKAYDLQEKTSGSGNNTWRYFDIMQQVFGKDPNIDPPATASFGVANSYRRYGSPQEEIPNRPDKENGPGKENGSRNKRQRSANWSTPFKPRSDGKTVRTPLSDLRAQQLANQQDMLTEIRSLRAEIGRHTDAMFSISTVLRPTDN